MAADPPNPLLPEDLWDPRAVQSSKRRPSDPQSSLVGAIRRPTAMEVAAIPHADEDSGQKTTSKCASLTTKAGEAMKLARVHAFPGLAFSGEMTRVTSTALDRWILARIQRPVASAPVRFMLWDGFELPSTAGPPVATVVFKNRRALVSWAWDPDLNFGEAYMFGAVEIRGDLVRLLTDVYRALGSSKPRPWWLWQRSNDVRAAKENVHRHYDLGNEFYRLWLDSEMVYTCAYFPVPSCDLAEAQVAKMDLVCRKLRLKPGERVIEAGCGWGSLALFMAQHYGVTVRAFNVSTEQIAYARRRARETGLADRVEFVEDDYRNMRGTHDVFVSVGMLEHVGLADYPTFGRVLDRSLTDQGRGLLHFIGRARPGPLNPWIRKRIFPGAYTPTLTEVFERVLEPLNLSVLDVENLRPHYAATLDHWRRRFDTASDYIEEMFDTRFVRAWRLYLAGSQAAFITGSMQLFQVVFARGTSNAIPWRRGA
jgi:cyclopropane-fatty-acyl-phospholipid synthase